MDCKVLEPLKYYETQGKQEHLDNTENFLNSLVEKSGVNVESNQQTIEKWKKKQNKISALSKTIKKFRVLKVFLIIFTVIGAILSLVSLNQFSNSVDSGILLLLLGLGLLIGSIIILVKKVNPIIKNTETDKQIQIEKSKELENEGWAQMQPLNDLFSDYDSINLIEKTLPAFSFNKNFTVSQEKLFIDKYDFCDLQTDECSMIDTLSGTYAGNPFIFGRRRIHRMGSQTYHGSLRISWTETYRDSQGRIQTRREYQTLYASVTKPKPYYNINTFLAYGNQAAPNLSFSRRTSHTEDLSERELERKIKKGEQKLQKRAKKAIKNGGTFQEMANSEFDVLFGATDRNNEVEFRLMYTPLGQLSTVALLKDSKNYGDDFDFIKKGKCNLTFSDHAQNWKMHIFANDYKHFDYNEIKSKFININQEYFRSIFFDFAPFFSVPAYLEEPCVALEGNETYDSNYTYYEHEVMANAFDYSSLVHENSCTDAIIKTRTIKKDNGNDIVSVIANSYEGVERVDFIPVKGGDGYYHDVPVPWIEYIPLTKTSRIVVNNIESNEINSINYHGISAKIIKD